MNEVLAEALPHAVSRPSPAPVALGTRSAALRLRTLSVETGVDGVALITLDLPDRPVNVLTNEMGEELALVVEQVLQDKHVVGAVLTSGKSCFLVGADLTALVKDLESGRAPAEAALPFERTARLTRRIETGGKPFACAINGLALGSGLELALACHVRMLADDSKALVGLPHVTLGLLPAGGGTQRLPRLIGIERALSLLLDGGHVWPRKALELGLVNAIGPRDQLVAMARAWVLAHRDARQPWDREGFRLPGTACSEGAALRPGGTGRRPAQLAIVAAVVEGCRLPMAQALRLEAEHFVQRLADPLARQRMHAALHGEAEGAAAPGRACAAARLGVIGTGATASTLAYAAAAAGIDVVMLDGDIDQARQGRSHAEHAVAREVECQRSSREQAHALLARIRATTDAALLAGCDLVIDMTSGQCADALPAKPVQRPFSPVGYRMRLFRALRRLPHTQPLHRVTPTVPLAQPA